jgi:hypothetical protein
MLLYFRTSLRSSGEPLSSNRCVSRSGDRRVTWDVEVVSQEAASANGCLKWMEVDAEGAGIGHLRRFWAGNGVAGARHSGKAIPWPWT